MLKKIIVAAAFILSQNAVAQTFLLEEFTGYDTTAEITITGNGTNTVTFNVAVTDPAYADINGVFFNIESGSIASIVGADVTSHGFTNANGTSFGTGRTGVNINGGGNGGPYDYAVVIGTSGIGTDDINPTSFTVTGAGPITIGTGFGLRATSLDELGNEENENFRDYSTKLTETGETPPGGNAPAPASALLMIGAFFGLMTVRRSKA